MRDIPLISIVVIGRNEAHNLPHLIESLRPLAKRLRLQTVYVDSASTDASWEVASRLFDVALQLEQDDNLSASAGRWTGCRYATGQWVLFLDGDMSLSEEFVTTVQQHITRSCAEGIVGDYIYLYGDGESKRLTFPRDRHGYVRSFGGAVVLPKGFLDKECWNPGLFSNEEIELYSRLRAHGLRVRHVPIPMVLHHTDRIRPLLMLRSLFFQRGSVLGKKFWGAGQVLAARYRAGTVFGLARWYPEPFAFWLSTFSAPLLILLGSKALGLLVLLAGYSVVVFRKGVKFLAVYLAFGPQAVLGWTKYSDSWRPVVSKVSRGAVTDKSVRATGSA